MAVDVISEFLGYTEKSCAGGSAVLLHCARCLVVHVVFVVPRIRCWSCKESGYLGMEAMN